MLCHNHSNQPNDWQAGRTEQHQKVHWGGRPQQREQTNADAKADNHPRKNWHQKERLGEEKANFKEKVAYLFNKEDLSKFFGIEIKTVFYIDLIDTSINLPQSNETKLTFSDNHLSYAITWYSLATVLLFIYLYSIIKSRREIR